MAAKRGAVGAVVMFMVACTGATANEVREPVYERPGIPKQMVEKAKFDVWNHKLGVFYERTYWGHVDALAGAIFARDVGAFAAELTRQVAAVVRPSAPRTSVSARSGGGGSCANPVVPEHVARAESGCSYDAYNPSGCSGGCIGFYQISREHYGPRGTCAGMGTSPGEQDACAQRIKDSSGCGAWTTWC